MWLWEHLSNIPLVLHEDRHPGSSSSLTIYFRIRLMAMMALHRCTTLRVMTHRRRFRRLNRAIITQPISCPILTPTAICTMATSTSAPLRPSLRAITLPSVIAPFHPDHSYPSASYTPSLPDNRPSRSSTEHSATPTTISSTTGAVCSWAASRDPGTSGCGGTTGTRTGSCPGTRRRGCTRDI